MYMWTIYSYCKTKVVSRNLAMSAPDEDVGVAGAQQLSFAEDVDLDTVAAITDGFSAADLQAVCSDAQLESVHTFLANREGTAPVDSTAKPLITMQHLQTAARNARPSVPEAERRKLNDIYASFMETRRTTPSKVCPYSSIFVESVRPVDIVF